MSFRIGETSQFPFAYTGREVWYFIIDETLCRFEYTAAKSQKKELVDTIKLLSSGCSNFTVFGVWQGKWKTDIFILDPKETIAALEKL